MADKTQGGVRRRLIIILLLVFVHCLSCQHISLCGGGGGVTLAGVPR